MANKSLSSAQAASLLDVLSHHALYEEITQFKSPQTITTYGPPFQDDQESTSPILQTLLSRFILRLPGLRDVDPDFWKVRLQQIIKELAASGLSESYDKGVLGIRKTIATAISALIEYPARGVLGGFPKDEEALKSQNYDVSKPDDVLRAFQDFLQQLVYGDLWEHLYEKTAETDQLSKQSHLVQGAHEYIVVNLASFMHYTLILSPEGPSLLRMVENVHKLAPYSLIRQTLRIGNVATMINGMVRLLLAKMSVASVTNWVGLSKDADEGMNLMQQMISTVLGWDRGELKKRLDSVEKDKDAPPKEARKAINDWISSGRDEHDECRRISRDQSMSLVAVILSLSPSSIELSEPQHTKALEYLSLQLSLRDRSEIIRVLCRSNPDHLTQGVREAVAAYEPMIRLVHQAVDLSGTLGDFEAFVTDTIKLSKPAKSGDGPPSVEDYVELLHKHQQSTHRFLHQVAKNSEDMTKWFKDYCIEVSANFEQKGDGKGPIISNLESSFQALSPDEQAQIGKELDSYTAYLEALHKSSASRVRDVIERKSSTRYGPGSYLARWQDLLDSTLITPSKAEGPVRRGRDKGVKVEARRNVDGAIQESGVDVQEADKVVGKRTPDAPDMDTTLKVLGPRFRAAMAEKTTDRGLEV